MFYDLFVKLCQQNKVAPTRAALDMGLSKSAPIKWRSTGATPQGETLNKIAAYFGVSADYLLGKEPKETPQSEDRDVSDEDIKFALFGDNPDVTDEMYEDVKRFARFIAEKEKE